MKVRYVDEEQQILYDNKGDLVLEAIAYPAEEHVVVTQYKAITDKRVGLSTGCDTSPDKVDIRIYAEEIEIRTPYDTIYFDVDW